MTKATETQISDFIKAIYKGEFESMTITNIETTEPNKYGEVKHLVAARTVWLDGGETLNLFSCNEQDGELY